MPLSLAIDIADGAWSCALPNLEDLARDTVAKTLMRAAPALYAAKRDVEIGLVFADDAFVRTLNRTWRGKDKPTNVLSFPLASPPQDDEAMPMMLGDVVLAFETVAGEARSGGKEIGDHGRHLIVHGVLHLLGHDHEDENQAESMESLEIEILAGIGVADPYTLLTDI